MGTTSLSTGSVKEQLGIDQQTTLFTHPRRWVLAILVVAALVVAVRWWTNAAEPVATRFITEPVTRGDLTVTVTATGTLAPINQVEVGSEMSGIVRSVLVDYNDRVREGQVLARLDTTKLEAQANQIRASLDAARARVQLAQATLDEARGNLERAKQLAAAQLISRADLDTSLAAWQRADAERRNAAAATTQAEASLTATQTDLTKMVIRSPITGVVLRRSIEPGQTVAASFQAPVLFTLAEDLSQMELEVDVDEADVGHVQAGQEATFTVDAYPERLFTARVTKVSYSSTTTGGVVTYRAALTVDNSELLLRPGMTTTADIVVRHVTGATLVPNTAFRFVPAALSEEPAPGGRRGGLIGSMMPSRPSTQRAAQPDAPWSSRQRVWIVRDGQPAPVDITVGMTDGRMTEVTGDILEVGTPVIVQTAAQE